MPSFPAINSLDASHPAVSEMYARTVGGSTAEQFHDQAEDCRRLSAKALKAVDKAFWLRLSDYWLELSEEATRGALNEAPARVQVTPPLDLIIEEAEPVGAGLGRCAGPNASRTNAEAGSTGS
jgi:hypothetical protein